MPKNGFVQGQATVPNSPARLAVVGCGTVARDFHLPVLAGHENIQLVALIDRDLGRARELADQYKVPTVYGDIAEINKGLVDGVIIATPPAFHASAGLDLIAKKIHVFVEKPLAMNLTDAQTMVKAAEEAGVVLSVGVFRRLLPCTRLLRAALENEIMGKPLHFDVADGAVYGWAAATLGNMRRELSGGGVLIDMGSHTLDRLLYLFPGPAQLLDYRDNALGGIESDCLLRLRLEHKGRPVEGRVELSRTRNLHNKLRVECEKGILELRPGDRFQVWVVPHEDQLVDTTQSQARPYQLRASWADEPESSWFEPFRVEIDDWLDAISQKKEPQLSGKSVLPTVALIDECYKSPGLLEEPWVKEGLQEKAKPELNGNLSTSNEVDVRSISQRTLLSDSFPRRVLLTGATGFIGCRVAEVLRLRKGCEVRALVHNPGNASRLARLPVDMRMADLGSAEDLRKAVEGCDAVVHCAIGTTWGQRREIFAITVDGTRKLAEAARAGGVKRFVHLSTIAIHGNDLTGSLDESTPVLPPRGDDYSESKAEAERTVLRAIQGGLPAVILRPANVFGPHSNTFVTRPVSALAKGQLVLVDSADCPSNTVYVDNVVEAIVRSLKGSEKVIGEIFTIGQGDDLTWGEFFGYFARHLGLDLPKQADFASGNATTKRNKWDLLGWPLSWVRGSGSLIRSEEFKAFGKKVLNSDPIGWLPRQSLEVIPGFKNGLRRLLKVDRPPVYLRPSNHDQGPLVEILPRRVTVNITKARKLLEYEPVIDRERAMKLTLEWVRHAQLANS
jgi:predicted dehydrogenase/nucleoside-diphosphate-sugar epimerase